MIALELDDAPADAALMDELRATVIAEKFDITPSAVRNWRSRGIPENRRDELLSMLARRRDTGKHRPTQGVPEPTQNVTVATLDVPSRQFGPPSHQTEHPIIQNGPTAGKSHSLERVGTPKPVAQPGWWAADGRLPIGAIPKGWCRLGAIIEHGKTGVDDIAMAIRRGRGFAAGISHRCDGDRDERCV
ncbi:MAG: hypothetical protein ACR2RF_09590 [Geminicoccaceae bacterium]